MVAYPIRRDSYVRISDNYEERVKKYMKSNTQERIIRFAEDREEQVGPIKLYWQTEGVGLESIYIISAEGSLDLNLHTRRYEPSKLEGSELQVAEEIASFWLRELNNYK